MLVATVETRHASHRQPFEHPFALPIAGQAMPEITRVFPSSTNFIMFSTRFAQETYLAIAEAGVVIRYRGNCHNCEGCLRATVGTREENDEMLEKLVRCDCV